MVVMVAWKTTLEPRRGEGVKEWMNRCHWHDGWWCAFIIWMGGWFCGFFVGSPLFGGLWHYSGAVQDNRGRWVKRTEIDSLDFLLPLEES